MTSEPKGFTIFGLRGTAGICDFSLFTNWLVQQLHDVTLMNDAEVTPDGRIKVSDANTQRFGEGTHHITVIPDEHFNPCPGTSILLVNDCYSVFETRWAWQHHIKEIERDLWKEHARQPHISMKQFLADPEYRHELADRWGVPGTDYDPNADKLRIEPEGPESEMVWVYDDEMHELNQQHFGRKLDTWKGQRPFSSILHEGEQHYKAGRFAEAVRCFEHHTRNRVLSLSANRQLNQAELIYKATDLEHDAQMSVDYGYFLQMTGRMKESWKHLEHRLRCSDPLPKLVRVLGRARIPRPFTNLKGQHLTYWLEGGAGDNFQFLRFIKPIVAQHGCDITVAAYRPIVEFLNKVLPWEVVAKDELEVPKVQWWLPSMSAPLFLQELTAIPDARLQFSEKTTLKPGSVGILWQGNWNHLEDGWRSCNPAYFADLADFPLVNLQHDQPCQFAANPEINDFLDLAKLVNSCETIVSVDSAVAHLAGLLGKRCLLLLSWKPDHRWGIEGNRTPWYVTHELIRQPTMHDWENVMQQVRGCL